MKRVISFILAVALIMSILPATVYAAETKKPAISKTSVTIYVGNSVVLKMNNVPSGKTATWNSSDKNVAEVDSNGNVTAISQGKATITATIAGTSYNCQVTVKKPAISKSKPIMLLDESITLSVNGRSSIIWSSSDESIAIVTQKGKVTALNYGKVIITATTGEEIYKSNVTVTTPEEKYTGKYLDPINLGGYTITSKTLSIKNDRFIAKIEKGVYLPDGFEQRLLSLINDIEDVTGLSFYPTDMKYEKINITIRANDMDYVYPTTSGIDVTNNNALLSNSGMQNHVILMLFQCIFQRNGLTNLGSNFETAVRTYFMMKLYEKDTEPCLENFMQSYSDMITIIDESNISSTFFNLFKTDSYESTKLGLRFAYYLEEVEGKGSILKLFNKAFPKNKTAYYSEQEIEARLKKASIDKQLVKFAKWYNKNENIFKNKALDYTRFHSINHFPWLTSYSFFYDISFNYKDEFTVDYGKAFEFLQKKNYNVKGFFGIVGSEDHVLIDFYDVNGMLLHTEEITNQMFVNVEVWGAVKLVVSGGHHAYIRPDLEQMAEVIK